jgi:hypothetical protein
MPAILDLEGMRADPIAEELLVGQWPAIDWDTSPDAYERTQRSA